MTIWRDPPEETVGLYPGLVVNDGRQAGSIIIGQSRLPVECIVPTAIRHDWAEVDLGWGPTEHHGYTEDDLVDFLADLLDMQGEFARLLLVLAAMGSHERMDDSWESPRWFEDPGKRSVVVAQLRRCLDALDEGNQP